MIRSASLTGLIAAAVLAPLASALAQDLPYESFELQQFPAVEAGAVSALDPASYPDLDPALLSWTNYAEHAAGGGLNRAVLTVEAARDCSLSLLYYSPAGMAYVVRRALPLPARSRVTATFLVPDDEPGGLTRLVLWNSAFEQSWLAFLARHPQQELEVVPDLLAEAWFARMGPGPARYPWEDHYRPAAVFDATYLRGADPYCVARLGSDGRLASKDCTVRGSAAVRLAADEYGILGLWELDWSSRLSIALEFPPGALPTAAYLVLYGSSGQAFGVAADPALEVTVNGWSVARPLSISPFEVSLQPIALDVSHYLDEGNNTISLQLSALSDQIWKVSRIELWIE